jgi:hypothetical protein
VNVIELIGTLPGDLTLLTRQDKGFFNNINDLHFANGRRPKQRMKSGT